MVRKISWSKKGIISEERLKTVSVERAVMEKYLQRVAKAAGFIREKTGMTADMAIITGTGLGGCISVIEKPIHIDYADIPGFPVSTVESHEGRLLAGRIHGRPVLAMAGRFHLYEGYHPSEIVFPIRVMRRLGVSTIILTNAAGGLNPDFGQGDIMIIRDHINLTGENPLVGPNDGDTGPRFPDMSLAYSPDLALCAESWARRLGIPCRSGVYAGLKGPSLETPAEIRFLRTIGADAVGFSTVAEVIAAVHAGMKVLALSIITNVHDPEHPKPASVEEIIAVADAASGALGRLLSSVAGERKCHEED